MRLCERDFRRERRPEYRIAEGAPGQPDVRSILGRNGVGVFRLDMEALRPVADRIGPSPEELRTPLSPRELPAYRGLAFREAGSFH